MKVKLKACPFCGSNKLSLNKKTSLYGYTGIDIRVDKCIYSVRCNSCHSRGGTASGKIANCNDLLLLPKDITTNSEIMKKAVDRWNDRTIYELLIGEYNEDNFCILDI